VFIVGATIGSSGTGRETLETGTLEINNQYRIRKKRMRRTLKGVASEGVLSGAGCLVALNQSSRDGDDDIIRKRQTWAVYHAGLRKPGSAYKRTGRYKSDHARDERARKHGEH